MSEIDDLIHAALYGPEDASSENAIDREVLSFIRMFNIKEAPNPIPLKLIVDFFKSKNPKSHVGRRKFQESFNKRFTPSRNAKGIFYRLDPVSFNLPPTYSMYSDTNFYPAYTGKAGKHNRPKKGSNEKA